MYEAEKLSQKRCLSESRFVLISIILGMEISPFISFTKHVKEEYEDIVAKSVVRLSHPPMEQHITDYKTQERPLIKSQQ